MIRISHVSRCYGDLRAVDDVSLDVAAGEVVGLLGPNGAGKTTLLRMIATLIRPDSGTIAVDGYDTVSDALAVRRRLGYQTGDTGLYARLTPREFLRYFARLHGLQRDAIEPRIAHVIDEFDIGEYADRPCGGLSTGQRQRVVLARTLLHEPPVLVLDEPTNGLDVLSSQFIVSSVRRLADAGRAVLFSTHILSDIELLCDRVIVLHRGRVLASGTVASLRGRTGTDSLTHAFLALLHASGEATP